MRLSDAIKKRDQLYKKAKEMDDWYVKQEYGSKELKWHEMKKAIQQVVDLAYEEWHKYNDAIEKDIKQLEIEIK